MEVTERLRELGGVADRATLVEAVGRAGLDQALSSGAVVRVARGRFALVQADEALITAHALSGVLSHTSAALHWGWELKTVPDHPHVLVPQRRKVPVDRRAGIVLHRGDLTRDDVRGHVTSPELTLVQCLRTLPFDEALAVADSALRNGEPPSTLRRIHMTVRGPGAPRVRRVCDEATDLAANPFESVLRAIALEVPGLQVQPQRQIAEGTRPDLVDRDLRLVLEADSFEWHGGRAALRRDAQRYNQMVVDGWLVLRFAWEDVMFEQDYVRGCLVAAVTLATRRGEVGWPASGAA